MTRIPGVAEVFEALGRDRCRGQARSATKIAMGSGLLISGGRRRLTPPGGEVKCLTRRGATVRWGVFLRPRNGVFDGGVRFVGASSLGGWSEAGARAGRVVFVLWRTVGTRDDEVLALLTWRDWSAPHGPPVPADKEAAHAPDATAADHPAVTDASPEVIA